VLHARIAIAVAEGLPGAPSPGPRAIDAVALRTILGLLEDTGPRARLRLARGADQLRRRPRDRAALAALILGGVW
jgi:hypothetical protein